MSQTTSQKSKWFQLLEQSKITKFMKNHDFQSRILFPMKASVKCQLSVKTFSNMKDLKKKYIFIDFFLKNPVEDAVYSNEEVCQEKGMVLRQPGSLTERQINIKGRK